ncbi:MAG: type II toxin-antitoxin system RelE/ParE family toxin [Candidatus Rifleibacteriota bacterium]
MKNKFKVKWTDSAHLELVEIIEHIAKEAPKTARNCFKKIKTESERLKTLPEQGRYVPELEKQNLLLYRELIVVPWRLIYKISGKNVYVLAVFDSRQNIEDILLKRLLRNK